MNVLRCLLVSLDGARFDALPAASRTWRRRKPATREDPTHRAPWTAEGETRWLTRQMGNLGWARMGRLPRVDWTLILAPEQRKVARRFTTVSIELQAINNCTVKHSEIVPEKGQRYFPTPAVGKAAGADFLRIPRVRGDELWGNPQRNVGAPRAPADAVEEEIFPDCRVTP